MSQRMSSRGGHGGSRLCRSIALFGVAMVCGVVPAKVVAAPVTYAFRGVFTSERLLAGPGPGTPWLAEGHDVVGDSFAGTVTIDPDAAIEQWSHISETESTYEDAIVTLALRTHTIAGAPHTMATRFELQNDLSADALTIRLSQYTVAPRGIFVDIALLDPSREMLATAILPTVVTLNPQMWAMLRVISDDSASSHELTGRITHFELVPEPVVPTLIALGFALLCGRLPLRKLVPHALLHCERHDDGG